MLRKHRPLFSIGRFLLILLLLWCPSPLSAGDPHSAYSSFDTDKILWFVHASDTHLGTSGSNDSTNLQWLTGQARNVISPSFIVVTGGFDGFDEREHSGVSQRSLSGGMERIQEYSQR